MSRTILSRPRTRVYGCNYDKGESYYKPMVDNLDRKYSARPLFSEPRNSIADEIAARRSDIGTRDLSGTRHGNLARDHDFEPLETRVPLSRPFTPSANFEDPFEETVFDIRGQKTSRPRRINLGEDFANEVASTTRKLRAHINVSTDSLMDEPLFDGSKTARQLIEEPLTRWTKLPSAEREESSAASRASRTRARLSDLEAEMEELADRQQKRERRAAALRALVNESSGLADEALSSSSSVSVQKRSVRSDRAEKHVTF